MVVEKGRFHGTHRDPEFLGMVSELAEIVVPIFEAEPYSSGTLTNRFDGQEDAPDTHVDHSVTSGVGESENRGSHRETDSTELGQVLNSLLLTSG